MASLERRVQAIGEGGAQITKRLVIRAALVKGLRRVADAHRELIGRIASDVEVQVAVVAGAARDRQSRARL